MNSQKIKEYILDFHEKDLSRVLPRSTQIKTSKKIQTIIGARRIGKTHLLFNKIKELPKEEVLYLNFESPILNDIKHTDIREIVKIHQRIFTKKKLHVFIDEPQAIDRWELAIRELHDDYNHSVYITGSSSKLLSKEIATSLRGRSLTTRLYPLSFKEFLRFTETDERQCLAALDKYIKNGGYPEVVFAEDENERLTTLKDYYDLTIFRDIIERFNIKNTSLIKWLMNYLTTALAKEVSVSKLFNGLKSQGIKLSKNTLYEYFSILEDTFYIHTLRKFDYAVRKEDSSLPKVYLNDVGFLNLFSAEEYGKRIENIVFIELLRKKEKNPLLKVNYWKNGREVDFVLREGKKIELIQVCYNIDDVLTRQREIAALMAGMEYFKVKEGTIITMDEENKISKNSKTIHLIPLWKYLMQ